MNRVVITGLGIYSCIGKNVQEVAQSLRLGKSGIIFDPVRKDFGYRSALTGFVERPNSKGCSTVAHASCYRKKLSMRMYLP